MPIRAQLHKYVGSNIWSVELRICMHACMHGQACVCSLHGHSCAKCSLGLYKLLKQLQSAIARITNNKTNTKLLGYLNNTQCISSVGA